MHGLFLPSTYSPPPAAAAVLLCEFFRIYFADEVELVIPIMNMVGMNMGFKTSSKPIAISAKDNNIGQ